MADRPAVPPDIVSSRVLRRLLIYFLPGALLTGVVVFVLYYQDLTNERALHEQAAADRVDLHSDIIRREMNTVESDLLYLANQAVLHGFLAGRADSRQELQDEYVLFCQQRGVYDQIRYLDAAGHERVRINYNGGRPGIVPEAELQPKVQRYYFLQTMRLDRGEVFTSPFDLNVEHDEIERPLKPMIRFATPVFDRQGAKRGILVLNYLGAVLLDKLANVSVGFPGSVWLVNRDGFFLRGPTSQDEWGFMLQHDRAFATSFPEEWQRLTESGRGQFRTERGLFTFRKVSPRGGLRTPPPGDRPASGPPDLEATNARMTVVAFIAPEVLHGRATQLLYRLLWLYGVVLLLILILAWYLAYAGALRGDQERHLADSAARLRTLSTQLLTAQEDERRSLSRDLHDELGQVVTSVTLDLQRAAQVSDAVRKDELIGRALRGTGCLLDHIHEISARLRPTLLDDLGLRDAVRSLLNEYQRRTGITTQVELSFEQGTLPPAVSENVYRILQEALTNVSKHSQAAEVFVTLRSADGRVALTVRDAGVGLEPSSLNGERLGILGMRERAELLDGTFVLKSEPGRGTEIQVTIPIPKG